jgi:hypothetical protein
MTLIRSVTVALLVTGGWMVCTPGQALAQKKQRDVISRAEIESSPKRADYIYDVIRSLRPHFLEAPRGVRRSGIDGAGARQAGADQGRAGMGAGGSEVAELTVFVDQNHSGGKEVLGNIRAELVDEVRFFDPSKATAEFGMTLGAGGAIVVKMLAKIKPPEKPPAL